MRHTVIGLFATYAQAESARNMLVQTGFASTDIDLQANPETPADAAADASPGVIANIERFLSSLFSSSGPTAPEAERYTDAVRRGAVLVAVNAASESHAELARNSLSKLGAIEVSERAPDARMPTPEARREHSVLDELGIGGSGSLAATPTAAQPSSDVLRAEEDARNRARMDALHGVPPADEASAQALAAASAPGAGAVMRPDMPPPEPLTTFPDEPVQHPDYGVPTSASRPAAPQGDTPAAAAIASAGIAGSGAVMTPDTAEPARAMPQQVPDEFLEYEEDFRTHYDAEYAHEGLRYDEYVPAYHYGATMAREIRYQDKSWDEVEPDVREDWERDKAVGSWERFKSAVRHGWDRVTGHHHR
ncbi:hypothetical protein [Paraburkholderia caribensis]|uniref:hypothetical protein n=1 Tax=Paraburkholderia caribensis TaxID=75105 RepID=UPI0006D416AB|nr:hypothetical protein [Paraburkholderia caribensis]ALP65268.1 hypothetical protein AN416_22005 [Paraburkholderia caribensis]AUT53578.1 hypothetical protein C2L66_16490 [Paraburkholderia caribensis]